MNNSYRKLIENAKPKSVRKKAGRLRKLRKGDADRIVHRLHEEVFETINCLQCANCCRTTGPLFTSKDIDKLSAYLGITPDEFENKYLRLDEDGDLVFQTLPCPFLQDDNYCSVYDARPKACREYPHTDRANQQSILSITVKNATICPAVALIFERLP